MQTNLAAKFLPIVSDEQKIEVTLENDKAVIKLSTWVEDLGWCGQKTLAIETDMLDELHRTISAARFRLNQKKADEGQTIERTNVISFPVAA
jgi:hypothetical protein